MGNSLGTHLEPFTNDELPVYDKDFLKGQVDNLKLSRPIIKSRTANEVQYNEASAYGLVAYKNQNPDSISDLDLARLNFEKKYESFLNWYGQYSNTVIKDTNDEEITYPVKNFFGGKEWPKPI
jgi:hypothetical protein